MKKDNELNGIPLINKFKKLSDFITYSIKCNDSIEDNKIVMDKLAEWYGDSLLEQRLPFSREIDRTYDKNGYYISTVKNSKTKPITTELKSCLRIVIKKKGTQNLPTDDALFLEDEDAEVYKEHPLGLTPKRIESIIDKNKKKFVFPDNSIEPTTHRSINPKAMALTMRKLIEFCYEINSPYMVSLVNHENKHHQSLVHSLGCYPIYPYVYFPTFGLLDENDTITRPTVWQPWVMDRQGIVKFMNTIHHELISNIS